MELCAGMQSADKNILHNNKESKREREREGGGESFTWPQNATTMREAAKQKMLARKCGTHECVCCLANCSHKCLSVLHTYTHTQRE